MLPYPLAYVIMPYPHTEEIAMRYLVECRPVEGPGLVQYVRALGELTPDRSQAGTWATRRIAGAIAVATGRKYPALSCCEHEAR